MYTRLIQGYEAMDQETKESSAFAAQKLRLMVSNQISEKHKSSLINIIYILGYSGEHSANVFSDEIHLQMSGSSALPRPVMHQWESITAHRLLERYGMTEVSTLFPGIHNTYKNPVLSSLSN